MSTIQVSARVDTKLKEEAQKVFERQGLDISTAIKMLIAKTANEQAIPMSLTNVDDKSTRYYRQVDPEDIELVKSFGVHPDAQGRLYVNQTTQDAIEESHEIARKIKAGEITESEYGTMLPSEYHKMMRENNA